MPNLEQTGLLKLAYRDLPEIAADEESWEGTYLLDQISAAQREELAGSCSTSCAASAPSTSTA